MEETLQRRKALLQSFYEKHDPGRIKNIGPLFTHFTFDSIYNAVKQKYGMLPTRWEYEPFFDQLGKDTDQNIYTTMKKLGLDPSVVLPNAQLEAARERKMTKQSGSSLMRTLTRKKSKNKMMKKRASDLTNEDPDFSVTSFNNNPEEASPGGSEKRFAPRPPMGPPPNRKANKQKSDPSSSQPYAQPLTRSQRRIGAAGGVRTNGSGIRARGQSKLEPVPIPTRKESRQNMIESDGLIDLQRNPSKRAFIRKESRQNTNLTDFYAEVGGGANVEDDNEGNDDPFLDSLPPPPEVIIPPSRRTVPGPPPPPPYDTIGAPPPPIESKAQTVIETKKPPPPPVESKVQTVIETKKPPPPVEPKVQTVIETKKPPPPPVIEVKPEPQIVPAAAPAAAPVKTGLAKPEEADLGKYRRMNKAGLPQGAILNCMERDGFDPQYFYLVEGGALPQTSEAPTPVAQTVKSAPTMAVAKPTANKTVKAVNSSPSVAPSKNATIAPAAKVVPKLGAVNKKADNSTLMRKSDGSGPKEDAKPKKVNKFAHMHDKLNSTWGLIPAKKEAPPPAEKVKIQVSSKFAGMHDMLAKQMSGGGTGAGAKKTTAPTAGGSADADSDKAKAVQEKFAQMKAGKEKKVLPIDSPEYDKYRKMQKTGLPEGAIRNCLERDGFDPEGFFNPKEQPVAVAPSMVNTSVSAAPTQTMVSSAVQNNMAPQPQVQQQTQMQVQQGQPQQQMYQPNNNLLMQNMNNNSMYGQPIQMQSQPIQMQPQQQAMFNNSMYGNQMQQYPMQQQNYTYPVQGQMVSGVQQQNLQGFYNQMGYQQQAMPMNNSMHSMSMQSMPVAMQTMNPNNQSGYGFYGNNNSSGYFPVQGQQARTQYPQHVQQGYYGDSSGYSQANNSSHYNMRANTNISSSSTNGWSVEWSEDYHRHYYFNKYTGESTWTPPPGM